MNRTREKGKLPGAIGATSFLAVAANGSGAEVKNAPLPAARAFTRMAAGHPRYRLRLALRFLLLLRGSR